MTPSGSPGLRGRTLRSFLLLGAQRVLSLLMIAAGGILLARLLTPEEFGLFAGADPVVRLVFGSARIPAVPALRLFCVTALLGGTATIIVHALYSLGRADLVLRLNLLGAAIVWAVTVARVSWLLAAGALRRLVPVRLLPAVRVPLVAGLASAPVLAAVTAVRIHDIPSLLIGGGIAAATYVGLAVVLGGATWRGEFVADWRMVLQGVRT